MTPTNRPVAMVTGASSGIGHATAGLLAARGFRVFGASRHPERGQPTDTGVVPLTLDVTDDASVARAVAEVLRQTGRLDVLVNNAGSALLGALEETSLAEAREQFETNFYGAVRLIHAVLPTMREHRRGRIINVSSVLGYLPAPYLGIYAATKHALHGYSETLAHEVQDFGIRVALVEPHFTRTAFGQNGRTAQNTLPAYASQRERVIAAIQRQIAQGGDPLAVAEAVHRAATAAHPHFRYPVGRARILSVLRRLVPAPMFDRSLRKQFAMDEVQP